TSRGTFLRGLRVAHASLSLRQALDPVAQGGFRFGKRFINCRAHRRNLFELLCAFGDEVLSGLVNLLTKLGRGLCELLGSPGSRLRRLVRRSLRWLAWFRGSLIELLVSSGSLVGAGPGGLCRLIGDPGNTFCNFLRDALDFGLAIAQLLRGLGIEPLAGGIL